jgi:hypothetical protein
VKRFDGEATVVRLRLQKQQVIVSTGSLELELPLSEVVLDDPPNDPREKRAG